MYLELLERGAIDQALECLRRQLTPRSKDPLKLYKLASLMACKTKEQLYLKANWGGAIEESRKKVLAQLLRYISCKKIMDSKRLEVLLGQALQYQVSQCRYHNSANVEMSLMQDHQCKNNQIPSVCVKTLTLHTDEVWNVYFSADGRLLATVSRDNVVIVWSLQKLPEQNRIEIRTVSGGSRSSCCESRHMIDRCMALRGPSQEDTLRRSRGTTQ